MKRDSLLREKARRSAEFMTIYNAAKEAWDKSQKENPHPTIVIDEESIKNAVEIKN